MTYARTVSGIANLGKPRARQTVHVSARVFRAGSLVFPVRVLVVPDGAKTGEYYAVYSQGALDALECGATPEYLCLEPFDLADEAPEYPADDRASSAADLAYQLDQERI